MDAMTTALVIGATGVVGRAVADELAGADHVDRIVTLTRRPALHESAKVDNRVVDFAQLDAKDFEGDLLFSALGTTKALAGSIEAQRVVDLDHQLSAARLAKAGGVRHLVLVSSPGANSRSRNAYLQMKGELEDAVAALGFERLTLVHPGLIVGDRPDHRPAEKLGALVLGPLARVPGLGAFQPMTGPEIARAMVAASRDVTPGRDVLDHKRIRAGV
jgi:uncharacterized protein YbjT (DUF2867 family)